MKALTFVCLCLLLVCAHGGASDMAILKSRVIASFLNGNQPTQVYNNAQKLISSLRQDGSWPNIDYKDANRVVWATATHLSPNTNDIALAYSLPGQPLYNSSTALNAALKALNYWLINDFQNPNWWWNQISVPLSIGQISLLLSEELPSAYVTKCVQIMARADWTQWTGANAVWMATAGVYSGLLTNDEAYVTKAFQTGIYGSIFISSGINDGIKQDASFFQHGPQIYDGGYGYDFATQIMGLLAYSANTSFAVSKSIQAVFDMDLLDGSQWMTRGKMWDWVVKGREITRPNSGSVGYGPLLTGMYGPRQAQYVTYAARLLGKAPDFVGNKHFWKADYMSHHRIGYLASVRMYSNRTNNNECVNDEGKKSLHCSDGTLNVYLDGTEYEEIFPVWDWEEIPGITCSKGAIPLTCATTKVVNSTQTFVGGVSDGLYGAAAFNFRSAYGGHLSAKKGWFFFDDVIVAVGTSIISSQSFPIITSVAQNLLKSNVYTNNGLFPVGSSTSANIWWVHHNNIGYIIPQPGHTISLNTTTKTGTWQEIGAYNGTVKSNIFSVSINQHNIPTGDSYLYYVVPNITLSEFQGTVNKTLQSYIVIENSGDVHAVEAIGQNIIQAIFWVAGQITIKSGLTISVDKPCIVLVNLSSQSVTVSDPQQHSGYSVTVKVGSSTTVFNLPVGEFAGSSLELKMK